MSTARSTRERASRNAIVAHRSGRPVGDGRGGGVKAIGALEVLVAAGLALPSVLNIAPVLVLMVIGAAITRIRRHETEFMVVDLVHVVLAGFVAWGRFGPESFIG